MLVNHGDERPVGKKRTEGHGASVEVEEPSRELAKRSGLRGRKSRVARCEGYEGVRRKRGTSGTLIGILRASQLTLTLLATDARRAKVFVTGPEAPASREVSVVLQRRRAGF